MVLQKIIPDIECHGDCPNCPLKDENCFIFSLTEADGVHTQPCDCDECAERTQMKR